MDLKASAWKELPAVRVTRARPEHAFLMRDFYRGLSAETRYERFFSHRPQFSDEELDRMSHPDPARETCVIAIAGVPGQEIVVGEARCVASMVDGRASEDAEIATVVADDWRRQGVGRALLCGLIAVARRDRVLALYAYITSTNVGMTSLVREFNFLAQPMSGGAGVRLVRKELVGAAERRTDPGCARLTSPQPATDIAELAVA